MIFVGQTLGPSFRLYLELQSRRGEVIQKSQKPTFLHCLKTKQDKKKKKSWYQLHSKEGRQ